MIRGAIDYWDGYKVGGWVYCEPVPLRDKPILAFVDGQCVGAGKVENLRPDLAAAGLGDGYCGFNFFVSLPDPDAGPRIVVRLEGSDFALIQRGSRIVDAEYDSGSPATQIDHTIDTIEWMREQNWLDQTGFDFLKHVSAIGLYDRSLRRAGADMLDPAIEAKRLFELYRQGPVTVQEALIELRNLAEERLNLIDGASIPVIAIHAPGGEIRLLEGSRNERKSGPPIEMTGATRHICRADRLLLLDTRATFIGESSETARIYRAI